MGFRQPCVARRRQVVSAFQVGVSSAKKRSYSVGERGLPGVEAEIESWAGAGVKSRSSTAGRGNRRIDARNSKTRLGPWTDRLASGPVEISNWGMSDRRSQPIRVRRFQGQRLRSDHPEKAFQNLIARALGRWRTKPREKETARVGGNLSPSRSERRKPAASFLMAPVDPPAFPRTKAASNGPSQRELAGAGSPTGE